MGELAGPLILDASAAVVVFIAMISFGKLGKWS